MLGATLETMSGAVWYVRKNYGEYGYRIAQESSVRFQVTHFDGSEFFIEVDAYGNAKRIDDKGDTK